MNLENKTLIAKGHRGLIYKAELDGEPVVVKVKNPKSMAMCRIQNEGHYLELLNRYGIGPKLIYYDKEMAVMEYIGGMQLPDLIHTASTSTIKSILKNILKQCHTMDQLGINKEEMHHPVKHIIIRNNKPLLIDFERCHKTKKPKNVTQFLQFLTSLKFGSLLREKGIVLDKDLVIRLGEMYKRDMSGESFKGIVKLVSHISDNAYCGADPQ